MSDGRPRELSPISRLTSERREGICVTPNFFAYATGQICAQKARNNLKLLDRRVKSWEIIADNLKKAGWSLGWVSALDVQWRTIWIVDAHGYGKRFIVRADEY